MLLKFDKVSKKYAGSINALKNINFEIEKEEFVFLVGSSGAGKTTLLRLIIRDIVPNTGNIFFEDFDITSKKTNIANLRRKIRVVFQDFKILMDRTIYENIAIALEILGMPKSEVDTEVKEKLNLVGLSDRENYFPLQLSAGELQRLSIARALIGEPKLILADEPTGNLDPATSWEIIELIDKINKKGTTIIMATHNFDIVNSLKRRVIKLHEGKIISDEVSGSYERPMD